MFRAAIFDMDGLLIDSEPFWKRAEREVFATVGVEIDDAMAAVTAPMTTRAVTEHWYRFRPWRGRSLVEVEQAVVDRVAELVLGEGRALPGVEQVLTLARSMGWRTALASNSPLRLCRIILERLRFEPHFAAVVSADAVEQGKPDPAIYRHAAQVLGVHPRHCLAFEDSATGVRAAKAAGMCVVAVPSEGQVFDEANRPDIELAALTEFGHEHAAELWRSACAEPHRR